MAENDDRGADVGAALFDYVVPEDFIKFPVADPDARFPHGRRTARRADRLVRIVII